MRSSNGLLALVLAAALVVPVPGSAADAAPPNDMLDAAVWMQTAIEYRANCLAVYALGKMRLDEALADKDWTAYGQGGDYRQLPPAVILDLDETAIDNLGYEAGLVVRGGAFDPQSWDAWTRAEQAQAVPGAVEFTQYAAAKGVTVFYISNRNADQKEATRRNLQRLGFPLSGGADTLLLRRDRPEWADPAKGPRIAAVARDYRVLLLFGDNINDFADGFNIGVAERAARFETLKAHFGHDWLMLANPAYGSWESAAYGQDFTLRADEKRARKRGILAPWPAER